MRSLKIYAPVAQRIEQFPSKEKVACSSHAGGAIRASGGMVYAADLKSAD